MKVAVLMTITIDGRIGKDVDHLADWSEKADKELFKKLTQDAGVIIMGSRTFDTIGKTLPERKTIVMTRKSDRISDNLNLEFTGEPPQKILEKLESEGYEQVVVTGGSQINTLFAREGLIDEVWITLSPLIFGHGISIFTEEIEMKLHLLDFEKIGEDSLFVRYAVFK